MFVPPAPPAPPSPVVVADAPKPKAAAPADLQGWRAVLAIVRTKRPALASVLEHAALLRFDAERVDIGYETGSFLVGQASEPSAKELLRSALATHFGKPTQLGIETIAPKSGNVTLAMIETAERKTKLDQAKKAVAEHPLVTAAIELLGAELRDVRLAEAET
jgi:DNA polymerase-3 subunit gamma/tau